MVSNYVALNWREHHALKFRAINDFSHAKHEHLLPVSKEEYCRLACDYPLVFVKNSETGQFQAVALTGIAPGQNLYWQQDRWQARRLPQTVQLEPFSFVVIDGNLQLAIRQQTPWLDLAEGVPLFEAEGVESVWLQQKRAQVLRYLQQLQLSREWVFRLLELELLEPKVLQLANGQQINGLYLISQQKLAQLSKEQLSELHQQGDMLLIMAHIISLQHIETLVQWAQIQLDGER